MTVGKQSTTIPFIYSLQISQKEVSFCQCLIHVIQFLSHIAMCKLLLSRCKKASFLELVLHGNCNGISVCSKDLKSNVRRLMITLKGTGRKYAFLIHERSQEEPWLSITHHMALDTFLCSTGCQDFTKNFSAEIQS